MFAQVDHYIVKLWGLCLASRTYACSLARTALFPVPVGSAKCQHFHETVAFPPLSASCHSPAYRSAVLRLFLLKWSGLRHSCTGNKTRPPHSLLVSTAGGCGPPIIRLCHSLSSSGVAIAKGAPAHVPILGRLEKGAAACSSPSNKTVPGPRDGTAWLEAMPRG